MQNRRGTTLVELLVTVVVMAIVGAAMVRLMTSQSRFFSDQEGQSNARRVAQSSLYMLFADLRMASASGVIATAPRGFTLDVPYRMGVSCGPDAGNSVTYMAKQPVDSIVRSDAGFTGFGYVDTLGVAHFQAGGNQTVVSGSICMALNIDTIVGGRVVSITPGLSSADAGLPMFVYERVRYSIDASATVPGSLGLFRRLISAGTLEEITAPLDSTAQFRYHLAGGGAPVSVPPVGTPVVGIELQLTGLNERNVTGGRTQKAPLWTSVFFKNR